MKTKVTTYIKRADNIQVGDLLLITNRGVVGKVQTVYLAAHTVKVVFDAPVSAMTLPHIIFGCDEMIMTIEM